ncbi:hypothetical protein B0H17DRAFT_835410, partial [Mycena rosella]
PWWMRSREELASVNRSSFVFAVEDTEQAQYLLKDVKFLAVFGVTCRIRRYADRPPMTQCPNCYKFDHPGSSCDNKGKCRLCGKDHTEAEHHAECTQCKAAVEAGDAMDTDNMLCTHNLCCINCKGKQGADSA